MAHWLLIADTNCSGPQQRRMDSEFYIQARREWGAWQKLNSKPLTRFAGRSGYF